MKFGTFLLSMAEPLVAKVMVAMGFSVVSIVGVEAVVGQVKASLVSSVNSMPVDMLNFALYLGIGQALGIIFGAVTTKLTLWAITNATQFLGKNAG